ncbi:MAG: hypothetical protein HY687_00225 [Chloroflexi bacterium]|nr:hypothetical protein [Chloroflexota bacterium]
MSKTAPIKITMFQDSSGRDCSTHCGAGGAPDQLAAFFQEQLQEAYGDRVALECLDLSQPATSEREGKLVSQIQARGLMLPAIAINGVLRLSGNVDYRTLAEAIEAQQELERGR